MPRKQYEGYRYDDPDAKYTYPQSLALINKFNIKDRALVLKKENQVCMSRILQLHTKLIPVQSMKDVKAIHRFIFQDMYHWAGEYRTVNISKSGKPFMTRQAFSSGENYINSLLTTYHKTAKTKQEIAHQLAEILDCLNHMHPFREGNGRCQREVILSLAAAKGYDAFLDVEDDDSVYNRYMDGTVSGDTTILEKLFLDTLEPVTK